MPGLDLDGSESSSHVDPDALLRAGEAHLAAVLEAGAIGTFNWNVQTGALETNECWATILGCTVDELRPLSHRAWLELMHPDDRPRFIEASERCLAGEIERCECELRVRHRDASWIWIMCHGRVMTQTQDGRPEWLMGIVKDITERKQREELLRKSQERLDRVGEIAGVGAWEVDLVSNEVFWSREVRGIHSVSPDFKPSVQAGIEFYRPEVRGIIAGAVAQAIADGTPWDLELPLISADGKEIWVRTVGAAAFEDGKAVRLTGCHQDITTRVAERRALRDANERLRLATDAGGFGIWDWDIVQNRLSWDPKMYELYGMHPGDGVETVEVWRSRLHPRDRAATDRVLQDCIAGHRPFEAEFRVVGDDGVTRHVRGAGVVTRDAAGQAVRMVGTNWDITAQKQMETERIEREFEKIAARAELERMASQAREAAERACLVQREKDRFRAAVDAVQGVLWTNDHLGRLVGEQPGWAALTGQELHEYQGLGWAKAVHPDDQHTTLKAWKEALAERRTFEHEHRVRRHDGCWRTFSVRAVPLFSPEDGNISEWVGVHTDITEQRQAEIALQETNAELDQAAEEFRTLAEGMADLCWMARPDGHIYWYNRRWYDYTGKSQAEAQGWGWQSVHDPEVLPDMLERWRASIANGVPFEMTLPLRRADGVYRPFLTRIAPLHAPDGSVRRWLGTNVDVSELKETNAELEERVTARTAELERLARHLAQARDLAERANQAKTRFLAGMSHELRTPLNGILGYAQMLRLEGGLSAVQQARVEAMLGAGNHLLEMITSVLDMSAIEANHVELQVAEVEVAEIMENCLDVIGAAAEAKGLSLSLTTMRGTPRRITTDPTRLRQVILNLLGNAVKFTNQGSIELRLRLREATEGLRIEVADTGPGIPVDLRPRLFQDFERLGTRATAAIEGSGLGLALSARLMTMLGGRIGHEDKPGGGSIFWLELPIVIADAPSSQPSAAPVEAAPNVTLSPLRVLVADDVAMNRDIVSSFLSSANHSVTCVEGGAEAIAAASSADFDVILMDVRMPDVDGLEATRRIRSLPGRRGAIPIIGLTAQAFAEQVAECKRAGMDAHVPKPFSPDALLQAVVAAVAQGHAHLADAVNAQVTPPVPAVTMDTDRPILEEARLEQLNNFLSADEIAATLENIAERGRLLLGNLGEWEAGAQSGDEIAAELHRLAGTAGMYGFARLAGIGQQLEYAIDTSGPEMPALAVRVRATVEATVENIRLRLEQAPASRTLPGQRNAASRDRTHDRRRPPRASHPT